MLHEAVYEYNNLYTDCLSMQYYRNTQPQVMSEFQRVPIGYTCVYVAQHVASFLMGMIDDRWLHAALAATLRLVV